MKSVKEWKELLRASLREAQLAREMQGISLYRRLLAAIDNAEARDVQDGPAAAAGRIAGSVAGLGAGDMPRRELAPGEVVALLEGEAEELRAAAETYAAHGKQDEAARLRSQVLVVRSLIDEEPRASASERHS